MLLNSNMFREYDIRGYALPSPGRTVNLDSTAARHIGMAFGSRLPVGSTVVVTADARLTSPESTIMARLHDYWETTEATLDRFANAPLSAVAFGCTGASYLAGKDEEDALVAERAGSGGFMRLNPTVDDIPDRYAVERDGIRLLVLGGVRGGGEGCACPANILLKALLDHLLLQQGDVLLLDMEAGIEHVKLQRSTACT